MKLNPIPLQDFQGMPHFLVLAPTQLKPSLLQPSLWTQRNQNLNFITKRESWPALHANSNCKQMTIPFSLSSPRHPSTHTWGTRNQVPCKWPQQVPRGNSGRSEYTMCISTNCSRKGTQPGGPEIVCVLLGWILKERQANLKGNWQQLHPAPAKMALCSSPQQLHGCMAAAAALTFLCVQEGLKVWATAEAASPQEAALNSRKEGWFSSGQTSTKWSSSSKPDVFDGLCWFLSSKSVFT